MWSQSITRHILIIIACLSGLGMTTMSLRSQDRNIQKYLDRGDSLWSSQPEQALKAFQQARASLDTTSQLKLLAKSHFGLAKTYYVLADYNNSFNHFQTGLRFSRKTKDTALIIYGLNGCGIALTMLKQSVDALKRHSEAILLCIESQDTVQWAKNLFNISIAYDEMEAYNESKTYVDSALSMAISCESTNVICQYRNHQAFLEIEFGHYEKAIEIFTEILNTEGFTSTWERQFSMAGIARALNSLNRPKESIEQGQQAFQMATRINSKWDVMEVSENLSSAYEKLGDYENALKFFKIAKENHENIYNDRAEKEKNFHLLQEERLVSDNLKLQNDSYQKEIKRKNSIIFSFILLFILLLTFLIVFVTMWRQKKRLINTIRRDQSLIEEQNNKLEKLNQYKDQIFKIIGHDLKNPLGVMIEFTELLQENLDDYPKNKIKSYLQQLNNSSWQGFALVNNLLNWAQVQTGELPFNPQVNKLETILDSIWSILEPQANIKKLSIVRQFDPDLKVTADEFQLKTIIRNLISNAIKYSFPEGEIVIEAETKGEEIHICIIDQGVGFHGEKMSKILHLEHIESQPGTMNETGTGLGLNLCNELVLKHKGRIWIEPNQPQGTKVCISIPSTF